jgi:hypothetical protein
MNEKKSKMNKSVISSDELQKLREYNKMMNEKREQERL